jgi:hypothetical protein
MAIVRLFYCTYTYSSVVSAYAAFPGGSLRPAEPSYRLLERNHIRQYTVGRWPLRSRTVRIKSCPGSLELLTNTKNFIKIIKMKTSFTKPIPLSRARYHRPRIRYPATGLFALATAGNRTSQRINALPPLQFSFDFARAHCFELGLSVAVGSFAGIPFGYCGLVLELDVRFWEGFLGPEDSLLGKLLTLSFPTLPVEATARSLMPNIHSQQHDSTSLSHTSSSHPSSSIVLESMDSRT